MRKKVLFLGNMPGNDPKSIGGANTYTQELFKELTEKNKIELSFLSMRKRWYRGGQIIDFLILFFKLPQNIIKHDVISIHATWDFHLTIGPFVVLLSKIFGKKTIYHFFGGNFHNMYHRYPVLLKWWLNVTIFKADFKLMETKRMILYFNDKLFKGFVWFPNCRKRVTKISKQKKYSKKFVFISRVTPTKGIDTILKVSNTLDKEYVIDIYGPLDDQYYSENSFKNYKANYLGALKPDLVIDTLSKYDVLLLPTFHPGEGYPGVFIEALSIGKPIICSNWNALDELVENNSNGKLIRANSTKDLKEAIEFFDKNNHQIFSKNSRKKFDFFDIEKATEKLLKLYLEND